MKNLYKIDEVTGCWIWQRPLATHRYGEARFHGKLYTAHRLFWSIFNNEELETRDDICHTCDNRACVNPKHLFKGTRTDNMRDCFIKGRRPTKLSPDQIPIIIQRVAGGEPRYRVGKDYGVSGSLIGQIISGKAWKYAHLRNESHSSLRS